MPQAVSRHTTPKSNGDIPSTINGKLDAQSLIAAYRKAMASHEAARKMSEAIHHPAIVHVSVPEIGPCCLAYTIEGLDRLSREHIANHGLSGVDRLVFIKQMAGYREALLLLEKLNLEWRKQQKIDQLEADECMAYADAEKAWKALLARIKSHPKDIPAIARYFATPDASKGDFWRPREVLRAIAGAGGKAARQ